MHRKIAVIAFAEFVLIVLAYFYACMWGFGEIKENPIALFLGEYEQRDRFDCNELWNANCIEHAARLADGSFFTEDGDMVIRIEMAYEVRTIILQIDDFYNPRGDEAAAVTAHIYGRKEDGELEESYSLLRVGKHVLNLENSAPGEYIISPSNIGKSSIKIESVELRNYKEGYREVFLGISFMALAIGILLFLREHNKKTSEKAIKDLVTWGKLVSCIELATAMILAVIYFLNYLKLPHIIHPEVYGDFSHYANEQIGLFLTNLVPKVFDNTMIEQGLYRPRALAFLWQYFDTNLMIIIDNIFPGFGIKMPLTLAVIPAMLLVWRYVFQKCFPTFPSETGTLFGAALLFIPNIQTATYFFLRSAKMIAPIVIIGLLNYATTHLQEVFDIREYKSEWKKNTAHILLFFVLCTLDEQVIAATTFIIIISIFVTLFDKKIRNVTVNFGMGLLMYVIYNKWWGRWLFEYFTPGELQTHFHTISAVLKDFNFSAITQAWDVYMKVLKETFHNYILLGIFVGISIGFWVCINDWKDKLISLALIGFSFMLTVVLLLGLPILYYYDDMIRSIYFICPILVLIYAIVYMISKSNIRFEGIVLGAIGALALCLVANIVNIEECHLRHLGINGGSVQFRNTNYDLKYFNDYYDTTIVTREQYDKYMEEE